MLAWLLSFSERPRFVELPRVRERASTVTGWPARQTTRVPVDLRVRRRVVRAADKVRTDRQTLLFYRYRFC